MAALQAGVEPGEVARCAREWPEVFQAWLEALEEQAERDRTAGQKAKGQELLAQLKANKPTG